VVGTSKTFKQLARLAGSPAQREGPFVRRRVTAGDLDKWIPRLAAMRARERARLSGVSRSRARQILAGAVVARAAMKGLNVDAVDVCPWALREGIVLHYLQTTHSESFDLPLRLLAGTTYREGTYREGTYREGTYREGTYREGTASREAGLSLPAHVIDGEFAGEINGVVHAAGVASRAVRVRAADESVCGDASRAAAADREN
jgi:exopolyphosphatase/pppGpp-phosphohydrolase